jgi:hypothetical protein
VPELRPAEAKEERHHGVEFENHVLLLAIAGMLPYSTFAAFAHVAKRWQAGVLALWPVGPEAHGPGLRRA